MTLTEPLTPSTPDGSWPYLDTTPGHAPQYKQLAVPAVGADVRISVHQRSSGRWISWRGEVEAHLHAADGTYTGLSRVTCYGPTSTRHMLEPGIAYVVEADDMTLIPEQ